jgi:hypothetical protein
MSQMSQSSLSFQMSPTRSSHSCPTLPNRRTHHAVLKNRLCHSRVASLHHHHHCHLNLDHRQSEIQSAPR